MVDATGFSPLSPEFQANPYPYYAMLRMGAPIFYWADWNMWICTRYDDCTALLRDNHLGQEILRHMTAEELGWKNTAEIEDKQRLRMRMQRRWILFKDQPDHTRLRTLVHKAFTPRMIEHLRGHIETITTDLIDALAEKGEFDLIEDFALPLPVTVIAEMLGVPIEDQPMFKGWSDHLAGTLDLTDDARVFDRAADATVEFYAYFKELAQKRRIDPQEDLLSALVQAEEDGDKLDEDELIATCILLLIAGHETTVNLIGNGVNALLDFPDQYALLHNVLDTERDALIKSATEEFLRYDSPAQLSRRWVLDDFEYNGLTFKQGQQVALAFGAANRDPERFENPDALDIQRENNKHMAFGAGIHFCLGAPLARMEGQIAFDHLTRRFETIERAGDPIRRPAYVLRGFSSLPVRMG